MKKIGLILFIAALVVGVVVANAFSFGKISAPHFFNFNISWKGVQGSGNSVTEKRDASGFKGVDVSGVFQVEIAAGKDFSVEVDADDNLMPMVKTEVRGGILHIETDGRVSPKSPLRVRISAPDIDRLESSGVSKISLAGVKNSSLSIDSSGASKIDVEGSTGTITVDVSGASNIDAASLVSENATIDASGASKVAVNVSNEINADASGASRISYSGSPKNVIKKTSGTSHVDQK
jgi:uncharacterized protein YfiM (DUF2279 family)